MKSENTLQKLVFWNRIAAPVMVCLIGLSGCASGKLPTVSMPSVKMPSVKVSSLWRREPASETAESDKKELAKKDSEKSSSRGTATAKKPSVKSEKDVAKTTTAPSRAKPKSDGAAGSEDEEKSSITAQTSRRERLRTYLKEEDKAKTEVAKKGDAGTKEDSIRRVSKSDAEEEGGLLSSLSRNKKTEEADPFLDDEEEDPIEAAAKMGRKDLSMPNARKTREIAVTETEGEISDLDREMAELGLKKKQTLEDEAGSRLESLLEADAALDEAPVSKSKKSTVAKSSASGSNPFEDSEAESEVAAVSKASKKTVIPTKTASSFEESEAIPSLKEEDLAAAESEEENTETAVKPVSTVAAKKSAGAVKRAANTPRAQADDLILQALAQMKKNQFEEACTLAESAAKLEEEHGLEYAAGEESPSRLLSQLNQLRGMMSEETTSSVKPAATKPAISPNPVSLPSLSPEVQPIDDETAALAEGSATQRVSHSEEEAGIEGGVATADAEAVPVQEVAEAKVPVDGANPFEDLGVTGTEEAADQGPQFAAADPQGNHQEAGLTTFASAAKEGSGEASASKKTANNSLGMMLVGISLVSLGCAGVFVWRAMRPTGPRGPQLTVVATEKKEPVVSRKAA